MRSALKYLMEREASMWYPLILLMDPPILTALCQSVQSLEFGKRYMSVSYKIINTLAFIILLLLAISTSSCIGM